MSLAIVQGGGEPEVGRGKHLGRLALVFYHRAATWKEFGDFLEALFNGRLHRRANNLFREQKCRHNVSGRHHTVLQASALDQDQYPMFNHYRYSQYCLSFGKGDKNKNPGFVVSDTCQKARDYLAGIGKGVKIRGLGDDGDYTDSPHTSEYSGEFDLDDLPGSSQVTDDIPSNELEMVNVIAEDEMDLFPSSFEATNSDIEPVVGERDLLDQGREDDERLAIDAEMSFMTDIDSSLLSVDPPGPDGQTGRTSTKIRAATLGYLWGFADDPQGLRDAFRRLRSENLEILHLCGCGIGFVNERGESVAGCHTPSHLKLGSPYENGIHKIWHSTMSLSCDDDYSGLCAIVHRSQYGSDLF